MSEGLRASVIIPVYNKEHYLDECISSIANQTMSSKEFEAVFVDDGSSDGSLDMLKNAREKYPWIKIVSQDNQGVVSARNTGIRQAKGKYLFFLDPDDSFSSNTLEEVSSFFDSCYDEIDLVTYPITPYENGREKKRHYRYSILTHTGIYDLNDKRNALICQTTMNICTKNRFSENVMFRFHSTNGKIFHEDQIYITDILIPKMKIGFCQSPEYRWNSNTDSVSSNSIKSLFLFENTLQLYEELFGSFKGAVPRYCQSLFVNDLGWKMRRDALMPIHLHGKARDEGMRRLAALIDMVDDEMLLAHPNMHPYHALYFLEMKSGESLKTIGGIDSAAIVRGEEVVRVATKIEIMILKTRYAEGVLYLTGFIKSPLFKFAKQNIVLLAQIKNGIETESCNISLSDSSWSRCGCRSVTARFFDFSFPLVLKNKSNVSFTVSIGDTVLPCYFSTMPKSGFSKALHNIMMIDGWRIALVRGATVISTSKCVSKKQERSHRKTQESSLKNGVIIARRVLAYLQNKKKKDGNLIWLYTDSKGKTDNAWIQYCHDRSKMDGVKRYYVNNGNALSSDINSISNEQGSIVEFGSKKHKVLFILADKILCSDISQKCYSPLGSRARSYYADYINHELIYLQHGVLWAHLPWYYSKDRVLCDREVVSTRFEEMNLTENYGFRKEDLIPCGMPRYDAVDLEARPENKILVCPSWRAYLIGELTSEGREPMDEVFLSSEFYRNLQNLLSSEKLSKVLDRYSYELHLKLHPLFSCYQKFFSFNNERIRFAPSDSDESSYSIIITDYSSYSFDFAYLKRALIYYIPDEDLFYGGINHYNALDIELEDAFGPYVHTPEDVIREIEIIVKNGGVPDTEYLNRMESLFLHYDSSQSERLYNALIDG